MAGYGKGFVLFITAALVLLLHVGTPPNTSPPEPNVAAFDVFDPLAMRRSLCGKSYGLEWFPRAAAATPLASDSVRSPHIPGLGTLTRKITTSNAEAQEFFDQGLRLVFAFNPGEAVASFRAASDLDTKCAMCFWGEALALGPNLNGPMNDADNPAAIAAAAKAQSLAANTTPQEQALIASVATRYSADKAVKRADLDIAFADAMMKVYAAYKTDPDIASLYADAAMEVRSDPWSRWWDRMHQNPNSYVAGAKTALEDTLPRYPDHVGAIHLYIHVMDGSAWPEKAEPYADKLAALMPNAGHMVHMPAHIFFNVGRYKDALTTNVKAIEVDDAYLPTAHAPTNTYRFGLYFHNVQFAEAAAEMAGDAVTARAMAEKIVQLQTRADPERHNDFWGIVPMYPIVRFGTPEEMLALPKPDRKSVATTAMWHYARGTAYAYQGDSRRALAEADTIAKVLKDPKKYGDAPFITNILKIAEQVVRGRVAAKQGKWDDATTAFSTAAKIQIDLEGKDPPGWVFPVRQALGVAYFRAGKLPRAAEALRQTLMDWPNDAHALYAMKQVSAAMGDQAAATQYGILFEKAWLGSAPPELDRF